MSITNEYLIKYHEAQIEISHLQQDKADLVKFYENEIAELSLAKLDTIAFDHAMEYLKKNKELYDTNVKLKRESLDWEIMYNDSCQEIGILEARHNTLQELVEMRGEIIFDLEVENECLSASCKSVTTQFEDWQNPINPPEQLSKTKVDGIREMLFGMGYDSKFIGRESTVTLGRIWDWIENLENSC